MCFTRDHSTESWYMIVAPKLSILLGFDSKSYGYWAPTCSWIRWMFIRIYEYESNSMSKFQRELYPRGCFWVSSRTCPAIPIFHNGDKHSITISSIYSAFLSLELPKMRNQIPSLQSYSVTHIQAGNNNLIVSVHIFGLIELYGTNWREMDLLRLCILKPTCSKSNVTDYLSSYPDWSMTETQTFATKNMSHINPIWQGLYTYLLTLGPYCPPARKCLQFESWW